MIRVRDPPGRTCFDGGRPTPSILIVEDERLLAEFYSEVLSDPYDVEYVTDGESALDRLDPSVDVVLLDRDLPDMTGGAVLAAIRDRPIRPFVAFVTGRTPSIDDATLDFDAYLIKPLSPDRLKNTVADLLDRGRFADDVRELYGIDSRLAAIEEAVDAETLRTSEAVDQLLARRDSLETELWTALERYLETRHQSTTSAAGTVDDDVGERPPSALDGERPTDPDRRNHG